MEAQAQREYLKGGEFLIAEQQDGIRQCACATLRSRRPVAPDRARRPALMRATPVARRLFDISFSLIGYWLLRRALRNRDRKVTR